MNLMNRLPQIVLFFVCFLALPAFASAGDITVTITGIENSTGTIRVGLFNDGDDYPDDGFYREEAVDARSGAITVTFSNVPEGEYAIAVMHDENDDYVVNTNALGIPREGVGVSNNYLGGMRRPRYDRSTFDHDGSTSVTVRMRYY